MSRFQTLLSGLKNVMKITFQCDELQWDSINMQLG